MGIITVGRDGTKGEGGFKVLRADAHEIKGPAMCKLLADGQVNDALLNEWMLAKDTVVIIIIINTSRDPQAWFCDQP